METAFIILNSECTRECPYCFYNTGHQKKREELLSAESAMSFISAIKPKGLKGVILTGGEPLLFPQLSVLIQEIAKSGLYTLLITNGDLLTDKKKNELQDKGLSSISVSLHIEGNNEKVLGEKMKKSSENTAIPLTFIFPLTTMNYRLAGKALEIAKNLGRGLILQPAFIPLSSNKYLVLSLKNLFKNKKELTDNFSADIIEWAKDFNSSDYARLLLSLYEDNRQKPVFCPMGTYIIVLNCDGEVVPCFHREVLSIGNIFKDEMSSIVSESGKFSKTLCSADCFGEHCVSLFA